MQKDKNIIKQLVHKITIKNSGETDAVSLNDSTDVS